MLTCRVGRVNVPVSTKPVTVKMERRCIDYYPKILILQILSIHSKLRVGIYDLLRLTGAKIQILPAQYLNVVLLRVVTFRLGAI